MRLIWCFKAWALFLLLGVKSFKMPQSITLTESCEADSCISTERVDVSQYGPGPLQGLMAFLELEIFLSFTWKQLLHGTFTFYLQSQPIHKDLPECPFLWGFIKSWRLVNDCWLKKSSPLISVFFLTNEWLKCVSSNQEYHSLLSRGKPEPAESVTCV